MLTDMGTARAKLLQGTLDMLILKALLHGEMHGYGIARRIRQLAREELTVEEGSLYPALQRLALCKVGSRRRGASPTIISARVFIA